MVIPKMEKSPPDGLSELEEEKRHIMILISYRMKFHGTNDKTFSVTDFRWRECTPYEASLREKQ